MKKLLMVTDAARVLGKSSETVRHYERTGKLRAMKTANGRRLFREADVQKLAAELEAKRKEVEAIRQKLARPEAQPRPAA